MKIRFGLNVYTEYEVEIPLQDIDDEYGGLEAAIRDRFDQARKIEEKEIEFEICPPVWSREDIEYQGEILRAYREENEAIERAYRDDVIGGIK